MKSRLLFFIFITGIVLYSSAEIIPLDLPWLRALSGVIIYSSAMIILYINSTFKSTPQFNHTKIGVVITFIGMMVKILHWPFSELFVTAGIGTAATTYFVYLSRRKSKYFQDFLKATWVTLISLTIILRMYHFHAYWLALASLVILTLLVTTLTFNRTNGG